MKDLIQSLIYIQQHLIVPKDQFNSFGKYHYRSLESILAAIKPLLRSQNCGIRFEDEVIDKMERLLTMGEPDSDYLHLSFF